MNTAWGCCACSAKRDGPALHWPAIEQLLRLGQRHLWLFFITLGENRRVAPALARSPHSRAGPQPLKEVAMMLHILSYFSSATSQFHEADLNEIVNKSIVNNMKFSVTGLLCYRDMSFVQFLEGDESVIHTLYAKIQKDARHNGFITMLDQPIKNRIFDKWYMALRNIDDFTGEEKRILLELFEVNLGKQGADHAKLIEILLNTFRYSFR